MFPNFVYTCKYITSDVLSCFEGTTSHKVDVFCTSGTFGFFQHRAVIHFSWSEFLHVSFKNDGLLKSQISSNYFKVKLLLALTCFIYFDLINQNKLVQRNIIF